MPEGPYRCIVTGAFNLTEGCNFVASVLCPFRGAYTQTRMDYSKDTLMNRATCGGGFANVVAMGRTFYELDNAGLRRDHR